MRLITSAAALTLACSLAACATSPQNPIYQQTTKYKASSPYSQNAPAVQQASYQTQAAAPVTYVRETSAQGYVPQQATYTRVNSECLSKESGRKLIGVAAGGVIGGVAGNKLGGDNKTLGTVAGAAIGGAVGYGIADKTINCDPISVPASAANQNAVITPAYQPAYESGYQTAPVYTEAAITTPHAPISAKPMAQTPGIQETVDAPGDAGTPGYYAVNGLTAPAPVQVAAPIIAPTAEIVEIVTPSPAPITPPAYTVGNARHTVVKGDTVYSLARTSCVTLAEFKQINGINDEFYIRVGQDITIPVGRCQIQSLGAK